MTKQIKSKLYVVGMLIILGMIAALAGFDETFAADKLVSGSVRSSSNNNPIMDHKFAADPFAMTYNGRVYVYMTNDSECYDRTNKDGGGNPTTANKYSTISTLAVSSSSDLVNWVDHGEINVANITSWARNSWAPSV